MQAPLPQFKPSAPEGRHRFHTTQLMVIIPLYVSLVLMLAYPDPPGPGLWFVFGFSAGLSIFLVGAAHICFERNAQTRWGARLGERGDAWVPWLLFGARCASLTMITVLFWRVATENGLPAEPWQHAAIGAMLVAFFAYQWASAMATFTEKPTWADVAEFLLYLLLTMAALLAGSLITRLVVPPGQHIPPEQHVFIVVLWVLVLLVPVICSLLWANHRIVRHATSDHVGPK